MTRHLCPTIAFLLITTGIATAGPAPDQAPPPPSIQEPTQLTTSGGPAGVSQPPALAVPEPAIADWDAEVSDLDKLRTPDSPAFVILGASPTEIQHPTTPRSLIVALGGLVSGGDLAIPRNVAFEVAPYWLVRHPGLTVQDYRDQALLRPLRTLSLSVGTTQTQRTEEAGASAAATHTDADIGLGFRTMLFQWGAEDPCTRAAKGYAETVNRGMLFTELEQQELSRSGAFDSEVWRQKRAEIEQRKAAVVAAAEKALEKLQKDTCVALAASTTGFSIDLAGALDVHANDARLTWAGTSLASYALWTNLSYDTAQFSGIAVARVTGRKDTMTTQDLFDAGLRGIYKQKTYAVSAEALVRHRFMDAASTDATTYKIDLALEYKVTDDTWLSVTFGKGFAFAPGEAGSWFSLANLQWSFGKPSL